MANETKKGARRATGARRQRKVRAAGPSTTQPSAWERLSRRTRHAIGLGILLLVTLTFFWPVTFGGMSLVGGDTVQWRGMAEAMLEYEEQTGSLALWAPNGFGGMPGYLIRYPTVVPQIDAVPAALRRAGWWPGAHFLVLLLGTYFLVFFLSRDELASALGAVAYGLTTYVPTILLAGHNTKFIAMAYAPWLILAFVFALRRPPGAGWPRQLLGALLFAVALAVNLRAEHVQITYYVVFGLGIFWLVEAIGAAREGAWKPFLVSTGLLALGGLLALAMVAHPYMGTAEYKAFTIRSTGEAGGLPWDYAMRWSQGIGELVTLLVPGAYGSDGATYWGPKPFTAGPHYVGPLVLLLAGLALYGIRRRIVVGLGVAAFVMVLFSLGEHFALLNRPMFLYFPLFDAFRVPETWLAVVALLLAVLAGAGAYYVGRREPQPDAIERKTRVIYMGLGGLGAVLVLLLVGHNVLFPFEAPGEVAQLTQAVAQQSGVPATDPRVEQAARSYLEEMRSERRGMLVRDTMRALVFLIMGGILLVLERRRKIPLWTLKAGLLLLVTVDLWQVNTRAFAADHPAIRTTADINRIIPQYGFDRYIQSQVEVAGGSGYFRTLPLALNPFNDGRTPYFYESLGGYHGAKLAVYQDFIDELLVLPNGSLNPTALDLMSTRFVVSNGPMPGMETVFEDPQTGLAVLERPDFLPRAFFVEEAQVVEDPAAVLQLLRDPNVNLRQTVYLNREPVLPVAAVPPPGTAPAGAEAAGAGTAELQPLEPMAADTLGSPIGTVRLVRHTPREILWEVETDQPRLMVASEVYYPAGWQARVGLEEVPIYRANYLQRAVPVPAGRHLVSMRYEPETHRQSVLITTVATGIVYLLTLVMVGLWWYRRGNKPGP